MFDPLKEILTLDLDWMKANNWTLRGILAYRHILWQYNHMGVPSQSKIMEIIRKYDAENQSHKISEALKDLLLLKQLFSKPAKITDDAWEQILSDYR